MCFSAAASFTVTALLVPTGLYASKIAWDKDSRYFPLAISPLAFGIQQAFEGIVWLGVDGARSDLVLLGARGFLLFSHGFWLVWPALTVFFLESRPWARKLLLAIALIGCLSAVSLYGPFLFYPDWLAVTVTQGSINYQIHGIFSRFLSGDIAPLIYMLLALGPLWLSTLTPIRLLGGLIASTVVVVYWLFNYAFISVWCFGAAIVSLYVAYILHSVFFSGRLDFEADA